MGIVKSWLTQTNIDLVLKRFRDSDCPTRDTLAKELGTSPHNIGSILQTYMDPVEKRRLSSLRYSRSKLGTKNPMKGKTGEKHHRFIGEVSDGYGYLTCLKDGKRQFVHRVMMAEALGLKILPSSWDIHHIDENKQHNHLDNFALVTPKGHRKIHGILQPRMEAYESRKSSLWETFQYMTSPSKKTKATKAE